MQKRIQIKNHYQEIQLVTRRSLIGLGVLCLLILILLLRLGFLQIYKQNLYSTLSTQNWLDLVPTEPTRGLIYDRHGELLVENVPVFSLDVIPYQTNNLNATVAALGKIISLSSEDLRQFQRERYEHRRFDEIPLKMRLTDNEVAMFTENQLFFPGVFIKARLIRHYPYGESFSHVLGYVGRINAQELNDIDAVNYSGSNYIGKLGIEKFYEEDLHGKVGYEEVENDASGKPLRVLKEIKDTPGTNLYLTIDSQLQLVAEKAFAEEKGALVAIQPRTGQVLAMISEPGYDPNQFVVGISQPDYRHLQEATDRPLFNRALRGLYPLASTIKPYYALAGLEDGLITADQTIYDPGWFDLNQHRYHDDSRYGHGQVDLLKAITVSCDTYFYQLAMKMGIRRMDSILSAFGFGELTGIDLDDELSGNVASPEWKEKIKGIRWYMGDTVNSGIGQGDMQATPLQLASAIATIANRGQRFIPYLLLGQQVPGQTYAPEQPTPLDPIQLKNAKAWDIIIQAMQNVISSPTGTGRFFGRSLPYTIVGKTGTGQIVKRRNPNEEDNQNNLPEKFRDHHLFVAFAPADNPVIALAVITEHSNMALKIARIVFDYYLLCNGDKPHPTPLDHCPVLNKDLAQLLEKTDHATQTVSRKTQKPQA